MRLASVLVLVLLALCACSKQRVFGGGGSSRWSPQIPGTGGAPFGDDPFTPADTCSAPEIVLGTGPRQAGQSIAVTLNCLNLIPAGSWLGLFRSGASNAQPLAEHDLSSAERVSGSVSFAIPQNIPTADGYELRLFDDTDSGLAKSEPFHIDGIASTPPSPPCSPSLSLTRYSYNAGEYIQPTYSCLGSERYHIGLYAVGGSTLIYRRDLASQSGTAVIATLGVRTSGSYELRLLESLTHRLVMKTGAISIQVPAPTPPPCQPTFSASKRCYLKGEPIVVTYSCLTQAVRGAWVGLYVWDPSQPTPDTAWRNYASLPYTSLASGTVTLPTTNAHLGWTHTIRLFYDSGYSRRLIGVEQAVAIPERCN